MAASDDFEYIALLEEEARSLRSELDDALEENARLEERLRSVTEKRDNDRATLLRQVGY